MRRNLSLFIGGLMLLGVTAVVGRAVVFDERAQKIEIYRAYFAAYPTEAGIIHLGNKTGKFGLSAKDIFACAPTVMATTAISRHYRTVSLTPKDFAGMPIRLVDPVGQRRWADAHEPAFGGGLWQVSDVGFDLTGQHALIEGSFHCGVLCGWGGTAVFERVGKRWVLVHKTPHEEVPGAGAMSVDCGSTWSY